MNGIQKRYVGFDPRQGGETAWFLSTISARTVARGHFSSLRKTGSIRKSPEKQHGHDFQPASRSKMAATSFLPPVHELDCLPDRNLIIARVPVDGFGIYATILDSAVWKPIGVGLPSATLVGDVAYDRRSRTVFVSSASRTLPVLMSGPPERGLYAGTIAGDSVSSWTSVKCSFPRVETPYISSFKTDPADGYLFIATPQGLFRREKDYWAPVLKKHFVKNIFFEQGGSRQLVAITTDSLFVRDNGNWKALRNLPWHRFAYVSYVAFYKGGLVVSTTDGVYLLRNLFIMRYWKIPTPAAHIPNPVVMRETQ